MTLPFYFLYGLAERWSYPCVHTMCICTCMPCVAGHCETRRWQPCQWLYACCVLCMAHHGTQHAHADPCGRLGRGVVTSGQTWNVLAFVCTDVKTICLLKCDVTLEVNCLCRRYWLRLLSWLETVFLWLQKYLVVDLMQCTLLKIVSDTVTVKVLYFYKNLLYMS